MRYTEKDLKTKYDNFTEYLSSIIELLLLSPFRLVNEISKKVVYLEQKRIEKLLLVATAIAAFVIGLEVVVGIFFNNVNLLNGKFPIVFQALAPLTILLIWGFVKNYDFSIHSKLEEILSNSQNNEQESKDSNHTKETTIKDQYEETQDDEVGNLFEEFNSTSADSVFSDGFEDDANGDADDDEIISGLSDHFSQEDLDRLQNSSIISEIDEAYKQSQNDNQIVVSEEENLIDNDYLENDCLEYDCAGIDPKQFINDEVYSNQNVKNYQNKHQTTVTKLQERDKKPNKNLMFTDEELQTLQKMCDAAVKNSKYIDDSTIEIALSNQKYDDFSQVDNFMENDDVDWLQQI